MQLHAFHGTALLARCMLPIAMRYRAHRYVQPKGISAKTYASGRRGGRKSTKTFPGRRHSKQSSRGEKNRRGARATSRSFTYVGISARQGSQAAAAADRPRAHHEYAFSYALISPGTDARSARRVVARGRAAQLPRDLARSIGQPALVPIGAPDLFTALPYYSVKKKNLLTINLDIHTSRFIDRIGIFYRYGI